jgi:hypothetical protein
MMPATLEPAREERPARPVDRLARLSPTRPVGHRSTPRPEAGGATCRP